MAILAMIEVHVCDNCQKIESVDRCNQLKEDEFEGTWETGITYSFCEKCKETGIAKARIEGEQQTISKNLWGNN